MTDDHPEPCPFCGEPDRIGGRSIRSVVGLYSTECNVCKASGPVERGDNRDDELEPAAVAAWNRRAVPARGLSRHAYIELTELAAAWWRAAKPVCAEELETTLERIQQVAESSAVPAAEPWHSPPVHSGNKRAEVTDDPPARSPERARIWRVCGVRLVEATAAAAGARTASIAHGRVLRDGPGPLIAAALNQGAEPDHERTGSVPPQRTPEQVLEHFRSMGPGKEAKSMKDGPEAGSSPAAGAVPKAGHYPTDEQNQEKQGPRGSQENQGAKRVPSSATPEAVGTSLAGALGTPLRSLTHALAQWPPAFGWFQNPALSPLEEKRRSWLLQAAASVREASRLLWALVQTEVHERVHAETTVYILGRPGGYETASLVGIWGQVAGVRLHGDRGALWFDLDDGAQLPVGRYELATESVHHLRRIVREGT